MTATNLQNLLEQAKADVDDVANAVDAGLTEATAGPLARLQASLGEASRLNAANGANPAPSPNGSQPHALPSVAAEAEEAVLGACMIAPAAIKAAASEVRPEHFYRDSHRLIYEAILQLDALGQAADAITVTDFLAQRDLLKRIHAGVSGGPEGKGRIYEIASIVPTSANVGHYAKIILRAALERRLGSAVAANPQDPEAIAEAAAALTRERVLGHARRAVDGSEWLAQQPKGCPAVWGRGEEVLWAEGEPLMIYGPDGVGKTSVAQQLVLARCGLRLEPLLGLTVNKAERPILYLACDRPRQARRSLYRMVPREKHEQLKGRLLVWEGPLPFSIPASPRALLDFCLLHDAGTVVVDSLKDVAVELTNPEVALKVNQAFQWLNANGVELLILHHPRKDPAGMPAHAKSLEDVYGDRNFVSGMGSVVSLYGKAGDPVVRFEHLKQPSGEVGPFKVLHDHAAGTSVLFEFASLEEIMAGAGRPLTIEALASRFFGSPDPSQAERQKVRYHLRKLSEQGVVQEFKEEGGAVGGVAFGLR